VLQKQTFTFLILHSIGTFWFVVSWAMTQQCPTLWRNQHPPVSLTPSRCFWNVGNYINLRARAQISVFIWLKNWKCVLFSSFSYCYRYGQNCLCTCHEQRHNSTRSFNFTPSLLYPWKKNPLAYWTGGWVGLGSCLDVWEGRKSLVAAWNQNWIV